ncbi:hypothetical protein [Bradyrhizobium canariense]|uniref:hypothetical protein n=1 Tax=Bradyrhizobium canariense TaxID=255045 RepID=UPI0011BAB161|nr:hypothetical protein [Bradyrhizobium canariense]
MAKPAQARLRGLQQRLVDLNLALHAVPPACFFRIGDLPPEQEFLQGQAGEARRGMMSTAVWCDSKAVPCFAPHRSHNIRIEARVSDPSVSKTA